MSGRCVLSSLPPTDASSGVGIGLIAGRDAKMTGDRRPAAGGRRPAAGGWRPASERTIGDAVGGCRELDGYTSGVAPALTWYSASVTAPSLVSGRQILRNRVTPPRARGQRTRQGVVIRSVEHGAQTSAAGLEPIRG
jgi:hypothetical protein